MQKAKNFGFMIGGIISGSIGMVVGIVAFVFHLVGTVFVNNPDEVTMTVNGEQLHGKEAAEAALKLGNTFVGLGKGLGVFAAALLAFCIALLILYFTRRKLVS